MTAGEHLFIKEEGTSGTFNVPDGNAVGGVETFSQDQAITYNERRQIGQTESVVRHMQGTTQPTWSATIKGGGDNQGHLAYLLQSLNTTITTSTPGGGTNTRDHSFIWNENGAINTVSMQMQRIKPSGTASTHNVRGATPSSLAIDCSVDGFLMLAFSGVAFEIQKTGTAFRNGNTSSAAATIAYDSILRLFDFSDLTVQTASAVTWDNTNKLYTLTSPTTETVTTVNASIEANKSLVPVLGQQYAAEIVRGDLAVTGSLGLLNNTASTIDTWRDKVVSQTEEAVSFKWALDANDIESGFTYEFEAIFPKVTWTAATPPDLSMNRGSREFTANFTARYDDTNSQILQLRLRNQTTSY